MTNISNKRKILLAVIGLVVIAAVIYLSSSVRTPSLPLKTSTATSDVTLIDTVKKTGNVWGEVPATDQLSLLASNQNGGSLGRIAFIMGPSSIMYLKAEIFGDENTIYAFFKYDQADQGWNEVDESSIPSGLATKLNNKLTQLQGR